MVTIVVTKAATIIVVAVAITNIFISCAFTHDPVRVPDINQHSSTREITTRLAHKDPCRNRILRGSIAIEEVIHDLTILHQCMARVLRHMESPSIHLLSLPTLNCEIGEVNNVRDPWAILKFRITIACPSGIEDN